MRQLCIGIIAVATLAACSGSPNSSFVDYAAVTARPPPETMLGMWQGRMQNGLLTFRVRQSGAILTCMEDHGYRYAGNAKYACGTVSFEDGSRADMRLTQDGKLQVGSASGPQTTILSSVSAPDGEWCQ